MTLEESFKFIVLTDNSAARGIMIRMFEDFGCPAGEIPSCPGEMGKEDIFLSDLLQREMRDVDLFVWLAAPPLLTNTEVLKIADRLYGSILRESGFRENLPVTPAAGAGEPLETPWDVLAGKVGNVMPGNRN